MLREVRITKRPTLYCSFCGRPEHECIKMVVGPNMVLICDVCIAQAACVVLEKDGHYYKRVVAEMDEKMRAITLKHTTESKGGSE